MKSRKQYMNKTRISWKKKVMQSSQNKILTLKSTTMEIKYWLMGLSGWLTQLVKCLLCKQKDPSLVPRTHTNKPGLAVNVCSSSATEVKSAELLSWMPSQCILIMELQASERPCPPPKKAKARCTEWVTFRMSSGLYSTCLHAFLYIQVHTPTHTHYWKTSRADLTNQSVSLDGDLF